MRGLWGHEVDLGFDSEQSLEGSEQKWLLIDCDHLDPC